MPWFPVNVSATLIWFLLFWNTGSTSSESVHREKRVAVLGTTEIPAASVDLSQFNFTDLVNGMLSKALTGAKKFFSFLSVTSYSSMAFHKVSIAIYNISNIKYVDYQKFPMRYCYCLNNRTNDLADYTLLLLDIVGNTTSSLTELFKSTSIVSVSQSNESDCIYFCVMTGRTGRNLSDLWDLTQKPPIINFTFPKNESSHLDIDSILPNLISSAEDTEMIVDPPKELWTSKTATGKHLEDMDNKHKMSPTVKSKWSSAPSSSSHDISFSTSSSSPEDRITKGLGVIGSSLLPVTQGLPSIGQSITFTKLSSWPFGDALKGNDFVPTRTPQLVGSLVPKGQHQPSEKSSLFPQNAFKEHSISFSSHKSQEGSQFKLPEWTTMAALEMLERPYSLIPLWAKTDHKTDSKPNGISSSQQPTRSPPAISRTQTDHSFSRISSLSEKHLPPGGSQALHASVSTLAQTSAPVHQISSTKLPVMQDSVAFDRQDLPTKRVPLSQHTHRKRDEIQSSMIHTSLGTVPQVKPLSMDGHKMAVHAYTQSKRTVAQESGLSPGLPELSDVPLRNINNFTFNGVFKNMESVTSFLDCLGSHFTWLQNIFTNFPALLNFVSRLKCVTGLCPKDLEDYGCTCRYEMEGLPVDGTDSCCFQHRKCYEEALELDCTWDPAKITADVSCLSKNLTCGTGDACEKLLCLCDKAAIECLVNAHINSSMKGIDITFCPALVTASPETTMKRNEMALDAMVQQNRSVDVPYSPTREGELFGFQNDATTYPSAEETTEVTEATPQMFSTPAAGPPDALSTGAVVIGFGTVEMGITQKSSVTPAGESTSRKIITTPTKTGFKMANESTAHSAASPAIPVTERELRESLERVCDRYSFYQTQEDGEVKAELPLLGEMLFCLTGRCPEEFESYGCYCGQEGKGNPTDILDSCCFSHQCCVDHLKKLGCQSERNIRSEVVCVDNKPTCVGWSICDKLLCACDKAAAECMAAAPFNETVRSLSRDRCRGETVLCSNGGEQEKPDRAIGAKSDSSSSEESSEERSRMRDIVGAGHMRKPNSGSPAPRARRPRSVYPGK